jgi:hypothetical protein
MLKNFFVINWQQKLYSLLLAMVIWAMIKEQIEPGFLDQVLINLGLDVFLKHLGWTGLLTSSGHLSNLISPGI